MLNFIFLFMYALAGACAAIDIEALNARQSLVRFEQVRFAQIDQPFSSHVLQINSLKDDSALELKLYNNMDMGEFPSALLISRKGATHPLAKVMTELTPSDEDYTCKVSVESYNGQNYAEESFVTRSNDLECMNLPKIDTHKVYGYGNRIRAEVTYTLPSDTNGTAYCLCVSICLSDPEVVSISLNKCSDYLLSKDVFVLMYDKGQITPRKVQL